MKQIFSQAVFGVNSDKDVDFILKHLTGLPKDPNKTIVQLQENQGSLSTNKLYLTKYFIIEDVIRI